MALIRGTDANDTLSGTPGADSIFGFRGFDTISSRAGADAVFGGDGGDRITGGLGDDRLFGGAGEDQLEGDQGSDRLFGGADDNFVQDTTGSFEGVIRRLPDGNDFYDGGAGHDSVAYTRQEVGIRVTLADDGALSRVFQGFEVDTLRNIESVGGTDAGDLIIGNNLANSFGFAVGRDRFVGRGGDDAFGGTFGELDRLFADGGAGNDSFDTGEGVERILAGTGADEVVASFEENPGPGRVDTIDLGRDVQADVYRTSMGEEPFIGGFIGIGVDRVSNFDLEDRLRSVFRATSGWRRAGRRRGSSPPACRSGSRSAGTP